jgi:hypothetical protein
MAVAKTLAESENELADVITELLNPAPKYSKLSES